MLIGINQIGLAIWGFIFLGAILGVLVKSKDLISNAKVRSSMKSGNKSIPISLLISLGISALLVSAPPVLADRNYRSALFAANGERIFSAGKAYPLDMNRIISTGDLMRGNGLNREAYEIEKVASQFNPDSIYTWLYFLSIKDISIAERENAIKNAQRLDPLWIPK